MPDWDKRYREGFYGSAVTPHELITRFWNIIPGKHIAEIAMGNGRDALFLGEKGFFIAGIDSSMEAIRVARKDITGYHPNILPIHANAAYLPFKRGVFDGVVVFYFLMRNMLEEIQGLLKKGGILMYETLRKDCNAPEGQENPDYYLNDGELAQRLDGLELIFYEETTVVSGNKNRNISRAVGRKR